MHGWTHLGAGRSGAHKKRMRHKIHFWRSKFDKSRVGSLQNKNGSRVQALIVRVDEFGADSRIPFFPIFTHWNGGNAIARKYTGSRAIIAILSDLSNWTVFQFCFYSFIKLTVYGHNHQISILFGVGISSVYHQEWRASRTHGNSSTAKFAHCRNRGAGTLYFSKIKIHKPTNGATEQPQMDHDHPGIGNENAAINSEKPPTATHTWA